MKQILYLNLHECQLKLRASTAAESRTGKKHIFPRFTTVSSLSLGHFVFCIALGIFKN